MRCICDVGLTNSDLALYQLDDQAFNGQHGRAYLFDNVANITLGDAEDRHMTTGLHTVRDIFCVKCNSVLGWKYVSINKANSPYDPLAGSDQ